MPAKDGEEATVAEGRDGERLAYRDHTMALCSAFAA
jgi:hypothetical protein